MSQPPYAGQPIQDPNHPGWYWDAVNQQWVPQPSAQHAPRQPQWAPAQQWSGVPHPADHNQQQWQGNAAQQWQGYQYQPVPPRIQGASLGMHLKRAIDWNVSDVVLSAKEKAALEKAGVHEPRMQGLLAWRRSTLMVSMPILVLSVILSFVSAGQAKEDDDLKNGFGLQRTGLGSLVRWIPSLALLIVPIAAAVVLSRWTELRRSSRTLVICWGLSIVIPLLAALIPISTIFDFDSAKNLNVSGGATSDQIGSAFLGVKVVKAVELALTILPVIVTVPGGVLKGAGRVKFLFPAAALPGWFLIAVAPFYSIFLIVVFILIDQIVGNFLLVLGVALLAFAPLLFVIHRGIYGRSMSIGEARVELPKAGRLGGVLTLGGLACVLIWGLAFKIPDTDRRIVGGHDGFFSLTDVARAALEVFGRNLVTAVVFSMVFLSMVFAEWRAAQQVRPDIKAEHDMEMQALRRYAEDSSLGR